MLTFVIRHLAASTLNHRRKVQRPFCFPSSSAFTALSLSLFHFKKPPAPSRLDNVTTKETCSLALFLLSLNRYMFCLFRSPADFFERLRSLSANVQFSLEYSISDKTAKSAEAIIILLLRRRKSVLF